MNNTLIKKYNNRYTSPKKNCTNKKPIYKAASSAKNFRG